MNNIIKYSSINNPNFLVDNIEKEKRRKKFLRDYREKNSISSSLYSLKVFRNFR